MASKNFNGVLRDPLGELANLDKIRFTHASTTGETIRGSMSYVEIGASGGYNFDIEYGNVMIETKDRLSSRWINQGVTTINGDTAVSTLPGLLNALVPPTDEQLIQFQSMIDDALNAADRAEAAADEILQSGEVNYTSGNTNFDEFQFDNGDSILATAINSSEAYLELHLNSYVKPTSISVEGVFDVIDLSTGIKVIEGVQPTMNAGVSSPRIAVSRFIGDFNPGSTYRVVPSGLYAKITVNF